MMPWTPMSEFGFAKKSIRKISSFVGPFLAPLLTLAVLKTGIIFFTVLYGLKQVPPRVPKSTSPWQPPIILTTRRIPPIIHYHYPFSDLELKREILVALEQEQVPPRVPKSTSPTQPPIIRKTESPFSDLELKREILVALERATPNSIPALTDGLARERLLSPDLDRAWTRAARVFHTAKERWNGDVQKYKAAHQVFAQGGDEFEGLHIALITFLVDRPSFYLEFNELCRGLQSVEQVEGFPYKHFYKLLLTAVVRVKGRPEVGQPMGNLTLYRGIKGRVQVKVGHSIMFQQFISTSRSKNTAEKFAEVEGTLFVIDGLDRAGKAAGGGEGGECTPNAVCVEHIAPAIPQRQEWECIVWPHQSFTVVRKEVGEVFLDFDVLDQDSGQVELVYLEAQ